MTFATTLVSANPGDCVKQQVRSRSIRDIGGSNHAEGMDVRLLCLLCAVWVAESATNTSFLHKSPLRCLYMCVCF